MHKNNNKYAEQLALIKNGNINVSSTNDGKDFLILLAGIVAIILIFLVSFDFIAGIFIDNMQKETQLKIESILSRKRTSYQNPKYDKQIQKLNYIKQLIINNDIDIQNSSKFNIYIKKNKEVNAMICPDGSIYFTTGILDKNLTEQELAFILAHEIGHYANRDHLKSISRKLATIILYTMTGLDTKVQSITNNVAEINYLTHSRKQEHEADLYAGKMLIKIYGTNKGGKILIRRLKEYEKIPEFLSYFSSHPSLNERYKLLETQQ